MCLLSIEEAMELRKGKRLAFTNGVFDILHAGHVSYLIEASMLGDLLIVGLNSDSSVKQLKGPARPIFPLEDRAFVLSELECVDGVVPFNYSSALKLIRKLRPEIYVKGGDYRAEDLPEARAVAAYGGEVHILPFMQGRSSTDALRRLNPEAVD